MIGTVSCGGDIALEASATASGTSGGPSATTSSAVGRGSTAATVTAATLSTPTTAPSLATGSTTVAGTAGSTAVAPSPSTATTTSPPTSRGISPVITYSAWNPVSDAIEVDGFVPGIVELDGTCEARFVPPSGGPVQTVPGAAVPDAATTSCGSLTAGVAGLERGLWTVTLDYESTLSSGTSIAMIVQVGP